MDDERPTIPEDLLYLLTSDHIGSVSSLRRDGSIATNLMWIDWDGEHVLTSSPVGSRKAANWRANPQVSVSVVDHYDDWRFVIVRGRVVDIRPDVDLEFIDRMSMRYTGAPYRRRENPREVFVIEPVNVRAGRGGWLPKRRGPLEE
ncbi:MAG TPA: pyridoxamine 5'-phosphate oxidase family protein [Candidatus Limnocylindrales bacterium]